jgi:TolB-like protein
MLRSRRVEGVDSMSLVTELRRRQVFRAAAWYAAAAWVAIQVASTVIPQFGLPDWLVRAVIVAAVLGLPIALALAWSFDLSAMGLRREAAAPPSAAPREAAAAAPAPLWRVPSFWIALTLGAGLTVSAQQAWQRIVRPAFGERPGLAVLPFANLSPDPANAYFADGLHEEILATFARAGGLRVISRTSVQQYRDPKRNLREIAEALDVSLILEGSVRREGDDLRLTLQLIDGRTDEHLWAETYDRKFHEALHLQRTVAGEVVAAIGATLTPTEQRLIAKAATSNPEAYDRYLHALALSANWRDVADLRLTERRLGEAIALEPDFALAYALRAKVRVDMFNETAQDSIGEAARSDIERALALQPDLPEAFVARGVYHTYVTVDAERGLVDLEQALAVAPNDAETQWRAGMTLRRLGRFDEALAHHERAARLSPSDKWYALMVAGTLTELGRHDEADRAFTVFIERHPSDLDLRMWRRFNHFLATGETAGWREEYDRLTTQTDPHFPEPFPEPIYAHILLTCTEDRTNLIGLHERLVGARGMGILEVPELVLGLAHTAAGRPERARPYLEASVEAIAALMDKNPDGHGLSQTAVALELLGRTAEAVRAADEAVRLLPEARDAVNGPEVALRRAWVLIHSGVRAEEGYTELERLLGAFRQQPRWVAVQLPWVILRNDTRAQQIIRSKFPDP